MRSRYTAYALGHVSHLMRTTHPDGPHWRADARAWADELGRYCEAVQFVGLDVRSSAEEGGMGRVTFFAHIRHGDRDASFGEDSRFLKVGGHWLYLDGTP